MPVHVKITDPSDISRLTGSKYSQSFVGLVYREVLAECQSGREVLFSGTPCQVAALSRFLRDSKLRSRVITVGLVCYGVPSLLVWRRYLDWVAEKRGRKVAYASFRDKRRGWEEYEVVLRFEDGSELRQRHETNPFFQGFLRDLYLQYGCYQCRFSTIPRLEDITLGDFWGVPENLKDSRGVSVVVANTARGLARLRALEECGRIDMIEVSRDVATRRNPRIFGGKRPVPPLRQRVLEDAEQVSFGQLSRRYLRQRSSVVSRLLRLRRIAKKAAARLWRDGRRLLRKSH